MARIYSDCSTCKIIIIIVLCCSVYFTCLRAVLHECGGTCQGMAEQGWTGAQGSEQCSSEDHVQHQNSLSEVSAASESSELSVDCVSFFFISVTPLLHHLTSKITCSMYPPNSFCGTWPSLWLWNVLSGFLVITAYAVE